MDKLSQEFWTARYQSQNTGWDIGCISTPLKTYIDQLADKKIKILIPGAGNSYEGEYLWRQGFKNVFIVDFSPLPLASIQKRIPDFPKEQLICSNFFDLDQKFDLIIEQTFFCALDPLLRNNYAKQMHEILNQKGKLAGVLFDFPLTSQGPPFGGSLEEYQSTFSPYFNLRVLERCHNSIAPRQGRELFVILEKKGK